MKRLLVIITLACAMLLAAGCAYATEECAHDSTEIGSDAQYHWRYCVSCEEILGEKAPHDRNVVRPVAGSTTQHEFFCSVCDYSMGGRTGHTIGWVTIDQDNCRWQCRPCGQIIGVTQAHNIATIGDDTHHFDGCNRCGFVAGDAVRTPHCDPIAEYDETGHYNRCGVCFMQMSQHVAHTLAWEGDGYRHYQACSECEYEDRMSADECSGGAASCSAKAVCEVCSTEYGELAAHEPALKHDDQAHWEGCANCDYAGEKQPHNTDDAVPIPGDTQVHALHCSVCGADTKQTYGHSYKTVCISDTQHRYQCLQCEFYSSPAVDHINTLVSDDAYHYPGCGHCGWRAADAQGTPHTPNYINVGDGTHYGECETCFRIILTSTPHALEYTHAHNSGTNYNHVESCTLCDYSKTVANAAKYAHSGYKEHWLYCEVDNCPDNETTSACVFAEFMAYGAQHMSSCEMCFYNVSEPHTLAYRHIDGNHRETCSLCDHELNTAYTMVYTSLNDNTHKQSCSVAGCDKLDYEEAHHFSYQIYDADTHVQICVDCDHNKPLAHDISYTPNGEICEKMCDSCFYNINLPHAYAWQGDDAQHWFSCENCGYAQGGELNKQPHSGGSSVCSQSAVCDVCDRVYVDLSRHAFYYTGYPNADLHGTHCRNCDYNSMDDCSGGTATCVSEAECQYCKFYYGEKKPHDYEYRNVSSGSHDIVCKNCKVTESVQCGGGSATCDKLAVCEYCEVEYGETKPHSIVYTHENGAHIENCINCEYNRVVNDAYAYSYNDTDHTLICEESVCSDLMLNTHDFSYVYADADTHDKYCVCGYTASGEAHTVYIYSSGDSCEEYCWICNTQLSSDEHAYAYTYDDNQHWQKCTKCKYPDNPVPAPHNLAWVAEAGQHYQQCAICEYASAKAGHAGGSATCQVYAVCDTCLTGYGEYGAHSFAGAFTSLGDDTHARLCTIDGCTEHDTPYACAGGSATCQAYAVCETCLAEYGEYGEHAYADAHELDAHYKQCALCDDIPDSSRVGLGWARLNDTHHVRVCPVDGCSAPLATQPHALTRVSLGNEYHRKQCVICDMAESSRAHTLQWLHDGVGHTAYCAYCEYQSEKMPHSAAYTSDGERHWRACVDCARETSPSEPCASAARVCGQISVCDTCQNPFGDKVMHKLSVVSHTPQDCHNDGEILKTCAVCGETFTSVLPKGHAFALWQSTGDARHKSECGACHEQTELDCAYFALEKDGGKLEICLICGDTLVDGARVSPCEYVPDATMTALEDFAIPDYARLIVFKFEYGYTVTLEYQGAPIEPLGAILVQIPIQNSQPITLSITQNGAHELPN